jgi:hypothetical protein
VIITAGRLGGQPLLMTAVDEILGTHKVSNEIRTMLQDTDDIEKAFRQLGPVDVVSHTYEIAEFLTGLASQLERNGFCASAKGRAFMRSIEDIA